MNKIVGVIVAMEREACLCELFEITAHEILCGADFYTFFAGNNKVIMARCGVGETQAAACTALLIYHFGVQEIINYGYAGALDRTIPMDKVLGVSDVIHTDMDLTAFGLLPGQYDGEENVEFTASQKLTEAILGKSCETGRLASADKFVADKGKKELIRQTFGARLCDMEGAGVASVCKRSGIPFALLKVVSDGMEQNCVDTFIEHSVYGVKPCVACICEYLKSE